MNRKGMERFNRFNKGRKPKNYVIKEKWKRRVKMYVPRFIEVKEIWLSKEKGHTKIQSLSENHSAVNWHKNVKQNTWEFSRNFILKKNAHFWCVCNMPRSLHNLSTLYPNRLIREVFELNYKILNLLHLASNLYFNFQ